MKQELNAKEMCNHYPFAGSPRALAVGGCHTKVGLKKAVEDFCKMLEHQGHKDIKPGRKFEEPTQDRKAICQMVSFHDAQKGISLSHVVMYKRRKELLRIGPTKFGFKGKGVGIDKSILLDCLEAAQFYIFFDDNTVKRIPATRWYIEGKQHQFEGFELQVFVDEAVLEEVNPRQKQLAVAI